MRSVRREAANRRVPHGLGVRPSGLHLSESLHLVDTVTSVQRGADLLVGLDEPLELDVEVSVLALESPAVGVESIDFGLDIVVPLDQVAIVEAEVVLLLAGGGKLVVAGRAATRGRGATRAAALGAAALQAKRSQWRGIITA